MTLRVFDQGLDALQGRRETFSRDFIQWLRDLVDQSNYALTFEAVNAALATADATVDINGQSLIVGAGSELLPALVIGALANGGMYSTANTLYWTTNGTTRMRLNGGNLFVYGATGITNGQVFLYGTGNGVLKLSNVTDSDFNRIQLGGDTSAFPSLQRSGTSLRARLADDSADTTMYVATPTASGHAVNKAYVDWHQTEVDLGSTPAYSGKFTITDATITATGKVVAIQAGGPYTGKGTLGDEAEMDTVSVAVTPAAGSATAYWRSQTAVRGNFKFNYQVTT
jgi:hypothetical protein